MSFCEAQYSETRALDQYEMASSQVENQKITILSINSIKQNATKRNK